MKQRLIYIDQLKGIAILLVIIGHLINDSRIETGDEADPVKWFIYTFHMPLFFFLSGIVLTKMPTLKKTCSKLLAFLAPFFVVGIGYTYYIGLNFFDFVCNKYKLGYWYLFVLAVFYVFHFFLTLPSKWGSCKIWHQLTIAFGLFAVIWYTTKLPENVQGPLSSIQMYFNWPFFISGYFISKYIGNVKGKRWICPLSLTIYVLSALIFAHTQFLGTLTCYLRGMGMIMFLVALFSGGKVIGNSYMGEKLAYLGTMTLDIYIYHYFVKHIIPYSMFGSWIYEPKYYVLVLLLFVVMAVLIAYVSILIGKLIRYIPLLRTIVYGKNF